MLFWNRYDVKWMNRSIIDRDWGQGMGRDKQTSREWRDSWAVKPFPVLCHSALVQMQRKCVTRTEWWWCSGLSSTAVATVRPWWSRAHGEATDNGDRRNGNCLLLNFSVNQKNENREQWDGILSITYWMNVLYSNPCWKQFSYQEEN